MIEVSDRIRAYLEKLEPAITGQHGHDALFKTSCILVWGFGLNPEEAWPFALEYNARCMPPWSEPDLRRKLMQAVRHPSHQKPRGHLLGGAELLSDNWKPMSWQERSPRPSYRPDKLEQIAAKFPEEVSTEYLEARSKFTCWNRSPAGILHKLFRKGEKVLVFTNYQTQGDLVWEHPGLSGNLAVLNPLKTGCEHGVWFLNQPIDGQWKEIERLRSEANPNGRTRRAEENVTAWRYAVLESDKASRDCWLRALVQAPFRIAAITESGGSSIHVLVRVDTNSKEGFDRIVRGGWLPALTVLGADPGALTAVRLTRLGNCERAEKGKRQRLLYLDPDPDGVPICEKPLRKAPEVTAARLSTSMGQHSGQQLARSQER